MWDRDNTIETDYSGQVPIEHRKKYAQFFTPYPLARILAKWLLINPDLKTVLEPAFGLGVFSRALLNQKTDLQIKGFEIDMLIWERAQKMFSTVKELDIRLKDYMYNDWDSRYDGIICNPPYFKFHDYDNKGVLEEIEKKIGCKLNGFTNLYTLFLLKSIYQLAPGGRCAYLIPSEFLNSDYGKLVKSYLLKSGTLRHVIVFDFEENVFDDALTTVSIVLCTNDDGAKSVQFSNISTINELPLLERMMENLPSPGLVSQTYSYEEIDPDIKWKCYYQEQNKNKFRNLVPFTTYARVVRGIATGANEFFTFSLPKAQQYGISEQYLLPCICKAADVKGTFSACLILRNLREMEKMFFF